MHKIYNIILHMECISEKANFTKKQEFYGGMVR